VSSVLRLAAKLLVGVLIFAGLPLLGWGLGDLGGFFANPARLGYVVLALLLQVVVVIWVPEAGSNRGQAKSTVPRQRLSLLLLQVVPLAIVLVAPFCDRRGIAVLGQGNLVRYVGLVAFAVGILGMHWAEASLDRQFSVEVRIQEGHQLVTGGPYRYLRHPRYLGIILFAAGISLVFRSWLALILVAVLSAVLVWRIHDEEMLLHREFGTEWEAYAARSWRLLPPVY